MLLGVCLWPFRDANNTILVLVAELAFTLMQSIATATANVRTSRFTLYVLALVSILSAALTILMLAIWSLMWGAHGHHFLFEDECSPSKEPLDAVERAAVDRLCNQGKVAFGLAYTGIVILTISQLLFCVIALRRLRSSSLTTTMELRAASAPTPPSSFFTGEAGREREDRL